MQFGAFWQQTVIHQFNYLDSKWLPTHDPVYSVDSGTARGQKRQQTKGDNPMDLSEKQSKGRQGITSYQNAWQ